MIDEIDSRRRLEHRLRIARRSRAARVAGFRRHRRAPLAEEIRAPGLRAPDRAPAADREPKIELERAVAPAAELGRPGGDRRRAASAARRTRPCRRHWRPRWRATAGTPRPSARAGSARAGRSARRRRRRVQPQDGYHSCREPLWATPIRNVRHRELRAGADAGRPARGHRLEPGVETHAFGAIDVMSPNSERFQPPKLWNAIGTGIGTLMPTMPTCIAVRERRARRRRRG